MSLLLLFARASAGTDTGHAEFPCTEALGAGLVQIYGLGAASFPATEAAGTGSVPQPQPQEIQAAGWSRVRFRPFDIAGSGGAFFLATAAKGRGQARPPERKGLGSSRMRPAGALGFGQALPPALLGFGSALWPALEASGKGSAQRPPAKELPTPRLGSASPAPSRAGAHGSEEEDALWSYAAAPDARRRPSLEAEWVDLQAKEDDELMLMLMEIL